MCGRYGLTEPQAIYDEYGVEPIEDMKPNYNAAPTQFMPVIRTSENGLIAEKMHWGLVPFFSKDGTFNWSTFNAKAEGIDEKPTWRGPFKRYRCVVPANGYIEWLKEGKDKTPFYFEPTEGRVLSLAGVYDIWHEGQPDEFRSFTIITTQPNQLAGTVHDRMPAILDKAEVSYWLDKDSLPEDLKLMLDPFKEDGIKKRQLGKDIGNSRNNFPELLNTI